MYLFGTEPLVVHVDVEQRTHAAEKVPPAPLGHDPQNAQVPLQAADCHLLHLETHTG